jgi:large subunit ribosomal protein L25
VNEVILDVWPRVVGSKGNLAALRSAGKIPAVFYGKGVSSESIYVNLKAFVSVINDNGANVIIDLDFKYCKKSAIVKSLQRDVLTQIPIHVDFQSISLADEVEVFVPIHIDGVPAGVKNFGGVMEFIVREVKIRSLPRNIPQKISVDVSTLGIGDGVTIANLPKLDGVYYVQEQSTLIVNVVAVVVEEEKTAAATESIEISQPEVISKGKKDNENEEEVSAVRAPGGTKK